jgi:hypothetical protein
MLLEVTQKHIKNCKPSDPCQCAVARALKEKLDIPVNAGLDDPEHVVVTQLGAVVYVNNHVVRRYASTDKLARFIETLDDEGKKAVKPTTLKLVREHVELDF